MAAPAPETTAETQHVALATFAQRKLRTISSTLRNGISSHRVQSPASFQMLREFQEAVVQHTGDKHRAVYVGSIDGEIVVSTMLDDATKVEPPPSKKRRRHDCEFDPSEDDTCTKEVYTLAVQRADEATTRVRAKLKESEVCADAFATAQGTLCRVLRMLRGARGESVVESAGLGLQPVARAGAPTRPLVVCMRLSAGVAVPLRALRYAMGPCFADGALSTKRDGLPNTAHDLPISETGRMHEDEEGQRTLVVVGSVPITAPQA